MSILLTGNGVRFAHLAAQLGACKLQLKGMRHSSGRSVIAHCKREYNLRGTNEFVVEQLQAMVDGAIAGKELERGEKTLDQIKEIHGKLPWAELQIAFNRGFTEEY
jgi:hypothetical protein